MPSAWGDAGFRTGPNPYTDPLAMMELLDRERARAARAKAPKDLNKSDIQAILRQALIPPQSYRQSDALSEGLGI